MRYETEEPREEEEGGELEVQDEGHLMIGGGAAGWR